MSRHPARRARAVTALLSAGAFAAIAGGLAANHAAASGHTNAPTSTTTPAASTNQGGPAAGSSTAPAPDDGGWTATPAPSGSLGYPPRPNHGQSGAS
jgi:hypothetical protein